MKAKIHHFKIKVLFKIKGIPSGLRYFWATGNPLKTRKNALYFILKAFFVLKIFKFLSWLFGHVEKPLDWEDEVNFEIYDVTTWLTNNCNTYIAQYLKKLRQSDNEIWSVNNMTNIVIEKSYRKWGGEITPRPSSEKSKFLDH